MREWIISCLLLLGWGVLYNGTATAVADSEQQPIDILVLLSYDPENPWIQSMMEGFHLSQKRQLQPIRYYFEYFDALRLGKVVSDEASARHLSEKYKNIRFEAAVADSPEACRFLKGYGDRLLDNGVPRVYATDTDLGGHHSKNEFMIRGWKHVAIKNTVEMAMQQNPDSEEVVIVRGEWAAAQMVHDGLKEQLAHYPRLKTRTLNFSTFDQLREQLADLPEKSLLFYILTFRDSTGKELQAEEVLEYIAEHASVPIYSFWKPVLGKGIVGGNLRDGARLASSLIEAAVDYSQNGTFKSHYSSVSWGADWRMLERYGFTMSGIADDVVYMNRPPSLVEHYFREIVWGIAIIVVSIALLTFYWLRKVARIKRELQYVQNRLAVEQRKQGKVEGM